jgi:hypothetical protein
VSSFGRAEIIPYEPEPDHAGGGKLLLIASFVDLLH